MPNVKDAIVRRRCLLLSLWAADCSTAGLAEIQRQLRVTHGLVVSADLVRADLSWLQEVDLCRTREDVAMLTERGRDTATGAAPWPGV